VRKPSPVVSAAVLGLLGSILALLALPASGGEDFWPSAPFYYFCRSDAPIGNAFYFTTTQRSDASVGRGDLQNAFMDFMRTKYKYPHEAAVSCIAAVGVDMQANTESGRQQTIDNLHAANYELVVTDWKYAH
jgi:hypothetical protein